MSAQPREITRIVLIVIAVAAMIVASAWILKPFIPASIWATTIVTATWPFMRSVQRRLWGKRWLGVLTMTLAIILIFAVPLSMLLRSVVRHEHQIAGWAKAAAAFRLSDPPAWLAHLPMVGEAAVRQWDHLSREGFTELTAMLSTHTGQLMSWFIAEVGALGTLTVQFLLIVIISAAFYATGESIAQGIRLFLRKLAGPQGDTIVTLVGRAIRGVMMGTVVAGLIIALLSGAGLAVAHVPGATLLTAVMFLLYLVQIGTTPVLGIASIWLYWNGHTTAGTLLLLWTVAIVVIDAVLRPVLMRRGAELPLPLIFTGVVGGLAAFGMVGITVGPVILAVSYTLLEAWVRNEESSEGNLVTAPTPGRKS